MMRDNNTSTLFQPPGSLSPLPTSRSSKSSSFQSLHSDDGSVMSDIAHFEDIGLEDDNSATPKASASSHTLPRSPSASNFPSTAHGRLVAGRRTPTPRRSFPNLRSTLYASNPRSTSVAGLTDPRPITLTKGYSTTSVPLNRRNRSVSPGLALDPRDPHRAARPRRGSWQANRDRRSINDLEKECEDDLGDDIPDGLFLDNVPISPRPPHERTPSRTPSISPSPDRRRPTKDRVRSLGNGTPAVAQAQGSLRSPSWKSDDALAERGPPSPLKTRVNSWTAAHAELSAETRALTDKLEEHAGEVEETQARRANGTVRPNTWNTAQTPADYAYNRKERVKSSTPELPPLRRTNIMVDPLPISKEKEAVLSRTRPSWLPPKDPVEEKRHLKEYQKMMVASQKADERREAARLSRTKRRDSTADSLMQLWEDDIIPRWQDAIRERRTRDLWWKGVAPRSRVTVWSRAIGNELGLSAESYNAALARARGIEERVKDGKGDAEDARKAKWFQQLRRDVDGKTWKDLRIFQEGGPLHDALVDVLSAYAMYRVDIGYISGCNTIAALLLLNLPDAETAFTALANVLNRPLPLSFYTSDSGAQSSAYNLVLQTLSHKSSKLHEHLTQGIENMDPALYLNDLFTSMFTSLLAIDESARLWDVYVFEGDALLVRAAVAVLMNREMDLLGSKTADEVWSVMSKASTESTAPRAVGEEGAEDRFMQSVRDAGKA